MGFQRQRSYSNSYTICRNNKALLIDVRWSRLGFMYHCSYLLPEAQSCSTLFSFLIVHRLSCYWYFSWVFTARWRCHIDCAIHKLQCWLLVTCSYKTKTVFPEPVCVSLLMIKCWLYVLAGGSVKGSQYNTISHFSIALALKFSLALLYSLQLASICLKALGLWSNSAEVILWIPQTCLMFSLLHICDCVLSCYWWIILWPWESGRIADASRFGDDSVAISSGVTTS